MSFDEVQFPTDIAYGSSGGPTRKTDIIVLTSGFEQRNTSWLTSRRKYNVSYGIKTYDQLYEVMAFWEARLGNLRGFRFKDFQDYKSCAPQTAITATDCVIGVGTGAETEFFLSKAYTSGGNTYTRAISKPVTDTVQIALDGTPLASTEYDVNYTTGLITFNDPPDADVEITAGFEFDVPVRFDADQLTINLEGFKHGSVEDIMLVELLIDTNDTANYELREDSGICLRE